MRAYYEKILASTYMIFGVNQLEKLDDEQLQFLLDGLEGVSRLYSYIPEEFQKKIIRTRMLKDKDYRNINLNLIARWFEEDGKTFFTQKHHAENKHNPNYKPLEGEERDKAIQVYLETLSKVQTNWGGEGVKGSGSRLREQFAPLPTIPPEESALNEYCNEQASNKEGSEGTPEDSGLPENSSNPSEQNNDSQDQEIIS